MDKMNPIPTTDRAVRPVVFIYPLGLWVAMAVFAVINGIFREVMLIPLIGERVGHVVSTVLLIVAILLLSYFYFTRSGIDYKRAELVGIGVVWVVLTVGFEFLVGFLEGIPVSETLAQYDLLAGQVWIFVPLALLITPLVFGAYLDRSNR